MPTDVELRLLKDLQIAVNGSTVKIAAEKEKDAHKLLALGGRQGELRGLLDQLLQKSSQRQGQARQGAGEQGPAPRGGRARTPVDDQELVKNLLDDNARRRRRDQEGQADRRPHGPRPPAPGR